MNMLDWLELLDVQLFLWVNQNNTPWLDVFFWFVSNKYVWIPLYVFFAWLLVKKYPRHGWIMIVVGVLLVAVTDLTSVHLFKNVFQRYRPCHNLNLKEQVHLFNNKCGGLYGFVSSHATNSTGFAVYVFLWLHKKTKRRRFLFAGLMLYVILIGYSRIYLGLHYPSDVVVGMLAGGFMAVLFYFLLSKMIKNKKPA